MQFATFAFHAIELAEELLLLPASTSYVPYCKDMFHETLFQIETVSCGTMARISGMASGKSLHA